MPRVSREVFAGVPHHITQRGNRREDVFFDDRDRSTYLSLLTEYGQRHNVEVLAYCLMSNHLHLVMVPEDKEGLQRCLKPVHMRYAQAVNKRYGWSGHLWQGRFFSSPLDESYLWNCIRYVERNPVRAGMVKFAEDYFWSSAAAHCGLREDRLLADRNSHFEVFEGVQNWSEWLGEEEDDRQLKTLRSNIQQNLPCGSDQFIENLERLSGRRLRVRSVGRPKRVASLLKVVDGGSLFQSLNGPEIGR